jgi:ribonuclease BN (tRNA processing enzyme)
MKVTVIGSGSMWNENNSASYMIDENILVDIPNGMCKSLFRQKLTPRQIDTVLITHFHGDHYFDMPFYMILKSKSDNKNINMFCSKDGRKKIKKLLKLAFPNSVKSIYNSVKMKYNHEDEFKTNGYDVIVVELDHGRMKPANGYIISDGKNKVGFTGDTKLCENVEYMANECNYLFCDCMFIKGTDKHMGIDNLTYLSEKYPKCKFVVSHMENDTREELKKKKIKNIIVPKDGDKIKI